MSFEDILNIRPLVQKGDQLGNWVLIITEEYRRSGVNTSLGWGLSSKLNPDGVDRTKLLEYIEFSYNINALSAEKLALVKPIGVYGFNMGMLYQEAEKRFHQFHFKPYHHVNKYRHLRGITPDLFEIDLQFFRQDNGSEVLYLIRIAQPNHQQMCELRKPHIKRVNAASRDATLRAMQWKKIEHDNDAMLMDWARHCKPWDDYSKSPFIHYAKWLMKASPTERHFAAKNWNWDYGEAPIIWISRQSDTDIATAITIFFLCEPSYYQKFAGDLEAVSSEHQRFQLKLILEIKMKIDQGFYSNSNIQLNLSREIGSIEEYRKKISQNQHTYPVTLKENYDGIKMSEIKLNIPNFGIS